MLLIDVLTALSKAIDWKMKSGFENQDVVLPLASQDGEILRNTGDYVITHSGTEKEYWN